MPDFSNPFRPGAGHKPPWLAGRQAEQQEFLKLLEQDVILENMVLTGHRGVGKTALLNALKPLAIQKGWIWLESDLTEETNFSVNDLVQRLCINLSLLASDVEITEGRDLDFVDSLGEKRRTLNFRTLIKAYEHTPGLSLDKTKGVLEMVWNNLPQTWGIRGIVFAYDEAQNLDNRSVNDQNPLSLLLDVFQSLQRRGTPLMLVLAGLPALFPKLVEARGYSERMFRLNLLHTLDEIESKKAIRKPLEAAGHPVRLSDHFVDRIVKMSAGYPYFIQFICREVYDAFIQRPDKGEQALFPFTEIQQKLGMDFFTKQLEKATDRQKDLLTVISLLDNYRGEFAIQEVVEKSREILDRPFSNSHVNQILATFVSQGVVHKDRHGKYSFAMEQLVRFIRKQGNELPGHYIGQNQ